MSILVRLQPQIRILAWVLELELNYKWTKSRAAGEHLGSFAAPNSYFGMCRIDPDTCFFLFLDIHFPSPSLFSLSCCVRRLQWRSQRPSVAPLSSACRGIQSPYLNLQLRSRSDPRLRISAARSPYRFDQLQSKVVYFSILLRKWRYQIDSILEMYGDKIYRIQVVCQ